MFGPVSDMVPSTPIFEMYPLGFTTMAEYMERHGLRVRIVNLAVLMLNKPNFDVEAYLRSMDPVAFGIDLHWLPHCHGSIEVAKIVKKLHPTTPVIFGGLSATYFHEELITYDAVDYVVRGDSTEEPMTRLMWSLKRGGGIGGPDFEFAEWEFAAAVLAMDREGEGAALRIHGERCLELIASPIRLTLVAAGGPAFHVATGLAVDRVFHIEVLLVVIGLGVFKLQGDGFFALPPAGTKLAAN